MLVIDFPFLSWTVEFLNYFWFNILASLKICAFLFSLLFIYNSLASITFSPILLIKFLIWCDKFFLFLISNLWVSIFLQFDILFLKYFCYFDDYLRVIDADIILICHWFDETYCFSFVVVINFWMSFYLL